MRRAPVALALVPALGGCAGIQSMTGGDGFHGRQFNGLLTLFGVVTALSYVLVISFLVWALLRRREPGGERGLRLGLAGWSGFIVLGLTVLTLASYLTDRSGAIAAARAVPIEIELTANQWWWDVAYNAPSPSDRVRTANELHLAAGVPAHISLKSSDVIHSFWVPNLAGKQDLIPGRSTDILLIPEKPGRYRGQCAEFCGAQHAHMALDVIVHSRADFKRWLAAQRAPAAPPATPLQQAGYAYVTTRECALCHNIAGTPATGQVAPDLTHLASRLSIGAGTFPMSRGHLQAWVADPQGAKPGNHMPIVGLEPNELNAVVAYLGSLK